MLSALAATAVRLRAILPSLVASFVLVAALCPAVAAAPDDKSHFLWKLSNEERTVYLLGSIHTLRESDYPLADEVESAYLDAQRLVFEVDLDDLDSIGPAVLSRGLLEEGSTLLGELSEERRGRIEAAATARGYDLAQFGRLKPWSAALVVVVIETQKAGFRSQLGVDRYFMSKASRDGKPYHGLETAEFQLDLFDGMPVDAQEEMLLQTLEQADPISVIDSLVGPWKAGDLEGLQLVLLGAFAELPHFYESFLVNRNRSWVPQIEGLLDGPGDSNYLVIVGAGHLVGPDSLIRMFQDRGHEVVPL